MPVAKTTKTTTTKKPTTVKKTTTAKKATTTSTRKTTSTKKATPVTKKTTTKKTTVSTKATEVEKAKRNELIESILKKNANKNAESESIPFILHTFESPKEFVVVIDTKGNIYQEPVPNYCNLDTFVKFLATVPDVPEEGSFTFKSQIYYSQMDKFEIITSAYDGTRKRNPFVDKFPEINNETKLVGGNLIFTGIKKALSKTDVTKLTKIIETRLNEEEITEITDD